MPTSSHSALLLTLAHLDKGRAMPLPQGLCASYFLAQNMLPNTCTGHLP